MIPPSVFDQLAVSPDTTFVTFLQPYSPHRGRPSWRPQRQIYYIRIIEYMNALTFVIKKMQANSRRIVSEGDPAGSVAPPFPRTLDVPFFFETSADPGVTIQ